MWFAQVASNSTEQKPASSLERRLRREEEEGRRGQSWSVHFSWPLCEKQARREEPMRFKCVVFIYRAISSKAHPPGDFSSISSTTAVCSLFSVLCIRPVSSFGTETRLVLLFLNHFGFLLPSSTTARLQPVKETLWQQFLSLLSTSIQFPSFLHLIVQIGPQLEPELLLLALKVEF